MIAIKNLHARQILDSRGNPTVEVDCLFNDASFGRAAVPSGASTGSHEALELRDGDKALYGGKSVHKAVKHVNTVIAGALEGKPVSDHRTIDQLLIDLDGTSNKEKLGANAILGVSMAVCKARAASESRPLWQSLADQYGKKVSGLLPVPLMNIVNGGKHADNNLSFQEYMIVPVDFPSFSEALRAGVEIFHTLRDVFMKAGYAVSVGDEGGFAPKLHEANEVFMFLTNAIASAGYEGRVKLAIDAAASEFCIDGVCTLDGKKVSSDTLVEYYRKLCDAFPIVSIEDSHSEDDWEGFSDMVRVLGDRVQIVGDDLLVTNVQRIKKAIEKNAVNAVLIKLNQIGTVSETVDAISLAQQSGWNAIISHRSGETGDTFIAHLSVGLGAGQIKTGSLCRTERVCKYNELLRIEEQLGKKARYVSPF